MNIVLTSESDPQLWSKGAKKAQKKFWGFNGIWTNDLHNTGAMLYQLSYEACLGVGQEWVQYLYLLYEENDMCIW